MTQSRSVTNPGEIFLGDTYFPIAGGVKIANITVVPNPSVFGDTTTKTDNQVTSQTVLPDASSGEGVYKANVRIQFDRSWFSECETRFHNQVTLPPLLTTIDGPGSVTDPCTMLVSFDGLLLAGFGSKVYNWNGSSWSASEFDLTESITDFALHAKQLIIMGGTQVGRRAVGGAWTGPTAVATCQHGATADRSFVWAGSTDEIITQTTNASNPTTGLSAATPIFSILTVGKLFIGPGQYANDAQVWAITDSGIWTASMVVGGSVISGGGALLYNSGITWPRLDTPPTQAVMLDRSIYIPMGGLNLLEVKVPSGTRTLIGLDMDDGVPAERYGSFGTLAAGNGRLYATVNPTNGPPIIKEYRGGWHTLGVLPTSYTATQLAILKVGSTYRLYIGGHNAGGNASVSYMDIRRDAMNPRQVGNNSSEFSFATGPKYHYTPWLDFETENGLKLLTRLYLKTHGLSSTETVEVAYATDYGTTWTIVDTLTSDGLISLPLPSSDDRSGISGKVFQFRLGLTRDGGSPHKRPLVEYLIAEYMRLFPATYGYAFEIDLSGAHRGQTPTQMFDKFVELSDPSQHPERLEFTWRDDLEPGVEQTALVKISRATGQALTGLKDRGKGQFLVSVVDPYSEDSL